MKLKTFDLSFMVWRTCWITLKGGYLDFSHLTELKNIYITEIYMRKQYKSSKIKYKKITKNKIDGGFP